MLTAAANTANAAVMLSIAEVAERDHVSKPTVSIRVKRASLSAMALSTSATGGGGSPGRGSRRCSKIAGGIVYSEHDCGGEAFRNKPESAWGMSDKTLAMPHERLAPLAAPIMPLSAPARRRSRFGARSRATLGISL